MVMAGLGDYPAYHRSSLFPLLDATSIPHSLTARPAADAADAAEDRCHRPARKQRHQELQPVPEFPALRPSQNWSSPKRVPPYPLAKDKGPTGRNYL